MTPTTTVTPSELCARHGWGVGTVLINIRAEVLMITAIGQCDVLGINLLGEGYERIVSQQLVTQRWQALTTLKRPLRSRVWFTKPQKHWYGCRTLLPVQFGGDEYDWHCVSLGWTVTGRVTVAYKPCPRTSLHGVGDPIQSQYPDF